MNESNDSIHFVVEDEGIHIVSPVTEDNILAHAGKRLSKAIMCPPEFINMSSEIIPAISYDESCDLTGEYEKRLIGTGTMSMSEFIKEAMDNMQYYESESHQEKKERYKDGLRSMLNKGKRW